jgi:hypothetical protein
VYSLFVLDRPAGLTGRTAYRRGRHGQHRPAGRGRDRCRRKPAPRLRPGWSGPGGPRCCGRDSALPPVDLGWWKHSRGGAPPAGRVGRRRPRRRGRADRWDGFRRGLVRGAGAAGGGQTDTPTGSGSRPSGSIPRWRTLGLDAVARWRRRGLRACRLVRGRHRTG